MSISADGWFDWAIRDPGHPSAVNGGVNPVKGVVPHSAEGDFASLEHLHNFHHGRNLAPEGQRASWFATNLKDGRFVQHFSIYAQTWTSGCGYLNNNFVAWENEGRAGQPLTGAQNDNNIRVIRELSALKGWKLRRPVDANDMSATGYEHNESVRFGGAYTSCPSGRIPWALYLDALNEEDEMKVAPWWSGDDGKGRVIGEGPKPGEKYEINLATDFGPGKVYAINLVMAPDSTGEIAFKNGDFSMSALHTTAQEPYAAGVLVAGQFGTCPFEVIGTVKVAYLEGQVIVK